MTDVPSFASAAAATLPASIAPLIEQMDRLQLDMLTAALSAVVGDVDEIDEATALALVTEIMREEEPQPTIVDTMAAMSKEQLQEVAEAPLALPADRYLAQAEILIRAGELEEPKTTGVWPIDYSKVYAWRQRELVLYDQDPGYLEQRRAFYASGVEGCIAWINHWVDTHDPRNAGLKDSNGKPLPVVMPLIMFPRQEDLVRFLFACMEAEADGLIEKTRDMGASWVGLAVSMWMWVFWDAVTVGWGSATAVKLDRSGDYGSLFEKVRLMARGLPTCWRPKSLIPKKHLLDKRIHNPDNRSAIVGEVGEEVGRGARARIYFVDEAAHFEHPEAIEAALSDTARVKIWISSVSGIGTVFHRTRQGGRLWERGAPIVKDRTNVLIMDWRHHPAKTQEWYDTRRRNYEARGLGHVFAQEVDRDYAASLEGVIIPKKWLDACVDAHLKIGAVEDWEAGRWVAGQDVADGGFDTNALVKRKGWVIKYADQWGERDTARTTRRMLNACQDTLPIVIYYDSVGVGSGIKAEANRLRDDGMFPKGITLVPWNGGAKVQSPGKNLIENDKGSPKNKDYFANMKAQAWWSVRMRVYRTFRAITEGEISPIDDMISFDSAAIGDKLYRLLEELAQPTIHPDTRMRMLVDKTPDGASSPNFGDACVECCFPMRDRALEHLQSLAKPLLVNAGTSCVSCGSRRTRELNHGRMQCSSCGHIWTTEDGSVDVRARGRPVNVAIGGIR